VSAAAADLHTKIAACTHCAAHLPLGPRPVVQFAPAARVLIIGQAPGTKVHESGIAWDDDSGDLLRGWLGLDTATFYDPRAIALMPMGFCYPGRANGGDAPPRRECAKLWHERVRAQLPSIRLTLLVGVYAQAHYLPDTKRWSMTERVRRAADFAPFLPLPHPAWRSRLWIAKNPWFETQTLPVLRKRIKAALAR
jgi:uracil-DNA glycosylase